MKRLIDYILSIIYILYFSLMLLIFHPIQVVCFRFFGPRVHQKSVHALNFFLLYGIYIMGASIRFQAKTTLPTNRPIIFIANHQSMFDIIGIIWLLRQHFPVFVSKRELAKNIPSISYNLQKSAALIDRADGKQAAVEIARLAKSIEETKFGATIFPEGTRSRTGQLKPFSVGGVAVLMKRAPNALIVPIAIKGTGKLNPKGLFPLVSLTKLSWTVLPIIDRANKTPEEVVQLAEQMIGESLRV